MNKKGFTLIELLAVIVILGILMMTAIPAVTRAIAKSRRNTFWQNMKSYAKSAATPFLDGEYSQADGTSCPYPGKGEYVVIRLLKDENTANIELEQGDPFKSSFKSKYDTSGNCQPTIIVANLGTNTAGAETSDNLQWFVAGKDAAGNGINVFTNINNLELGSVKTGIKTCEVAAVGSGNSLQASGNTLVSGSGITWKADCTGN